MNRTEKEKMIAGEAYRAADPQLVAQRLRARQLTARFNSLAPELADERNALLRELLGKVGPNCWIEPPFYCDYGSLIELGENVYFNFNCVILDCSHVRIGSDVKCGPGVQMYGAYHPVDPAQRKAGQEFAGPITIGDNAWIGGGSIICPNVTIGPNSVIGAGSVVTRDIPANVVAVGNPCRVLRSIDSR
ncbi:MAG: sugar O-acetyltransferase [Phycisphaeraceae bacterium]